MISPITGRSQFVSLGSDVRAVACGGEHTVVLLASGEAMALEIHASNIASWRTLRPAPAAGEEAVRSIGAGAGHTLLVGERGTLWTAAVVDHPRGPGETSAEHYQFQNCLLGRRAEDGRHHECGEVTALRPALALSADGGGYHSLVLTHAGSVFAFGLNQDGRLGLDDASFADHDTPQPVPLPSGEIAIQVAAGGDYSLVLTESGALYVAGDYEAPICSAEATGLEAIPSFCTRRITQISAGNEHCVALDEMGCVWSWATQTDGAADFGDDKRWARDRRDVEMLSGGLLLRNKIDWPFVEPTLVTAHYPRIEAVAAGGLISAAVGAWPHGAAETDLGAEVAAPWVFFGGTEPAAALVVD